MSGAWCVCVFICLSRYAFTMSINVLCVYVCLFEFQCDLPDSNYTLCWWPSDGLTSYWNIMFLNQQFDEVTCLSVIVPYGTPPGALNLDSLSKCLGGKLRVDSLQHTNPLSQSLIKDRTRTQYLGLSDTIRDLMVEISAICQLLLSLNTFDTQLTAQRGWLQWKRVTV